jgi:hypothetical protein
MRYAAVDELALVDLASGGNVDLVSEARREYAYVLRDTYKNMPPP